VRNVGFGYVHNVNFTMTALLYGNWYCCHVLAAAMPTMTSTARRQAGCSSADTSTHLAGGRGVAPRPGYFPGSAS
jgi:hypothetical protein